jgi:hypothetical protein
MSIERGPQQHRRQAKNYIHKEAQARLNETVPTFNKQVLNALNVDAVEVSYYHICDRIGRPCSCTATQISREDAASEKTTAKSLGINTVQDIQVEFQDSIFGDSEAEQIYNPDEGIDVTYLHDDSIPDVLQAPVDKDGNVDYRETVIERNNDCGICYRVGHVPGYTRYGYATELFTSLNIADIRNYHVDVEAAPHVMRNSGGGEILYKFNVPTYFRSVDYSIRINRNILKNEYFQYKGNRLTVDILRKYAGKEITVSIRAREFTHGIIAFDLGVPNIRANISAENTGLDYTLRDIVGNLTIVLPPTLHEVRTGDTIVIPNRRYVLRVMNRERKITADKRQLEWVAECRIIQPQENLKNIHKSYKLE